MEAHQAFHRIPLYLGKEYPVQPERALQVLLKRPSDGADGFDPRAFLLSTLR